MSLFTDSSLCLVPSGVKDGKLYSVKPTDGSGDLTFSRGSDIEATRVAANGYIEKAQVNLLLQSNTFSNAAWVNYQSAETGGQPDKDGGSTAWKITRLVDGSNSVIYQTGLSYSLATFSVYAKAAEENWIYIEGVGSTFPAQYFDLQNGLKGTASGGGFIDSSITSVGGGWYRVSITFNISGGNRVSIYQATADNTLSGALGDGIYIQDAQINYGLVAQEYQETTTTSVVAGITNDMPRLDYSGGASCPSLLLEGSRTNYITQSSYYGTWLLAGTTPTITTNYGISPEGVQNSSRLQLDTGDLIYQSGFSLSTGNYTFSVFGKAIGDTYGVDTRLGLRLDIPSAKTAFFDLVNGVVISQTADEAKIESYGNGWWRCSITQNNCIVSNAVIYGDDFDSEIYGAQLELGSYSTSLIPTYGTSATRTSEWCSRTGISSLIGQTEGTIYFEVEQSNTSGVYGAWSISDGSSTNRITMNTTNDTSTNFTFSVAANYAGSGTVLMSADATYAGTHKVAIKYSGTSMKLFVDGSEVGSATTTGFGNYTNYYLGANQVGGGASETRNFLQGLLFASALSDADCITLTSL